MTRWQALLPDDGELAPFRDMARRLIAAQIPPEDVTFGREGDAGLFGAEPPPADMPLAVPGSFVAVAQQVVAHADPERFALLYRLLWRMLHGERQLLKVAADPLVHRLHRMQEAVARDMHKMTAFVRFRRIGLEGGSERYVAWFEPEHFILRRMQDFFRNRFARMRWSILTPQGGMHWDGATISFSPGVARDDAPPADRFEAWWKAYYRAMFNPARANPAAMRAEMPKKYWRNLPEASLIPELLQGAPERTRTMLEAGPVAPKKRIPAPAAVTEEMKPEGTLTDIAAQAKSCTRCPLYEPATQTVFGEGPRHAPVMFVGEQPGDQEDLAGRPFVGPAGQLFDRALNEAGIDRQRVYVTNAVKHFKFVPRGKRRIHQKPDAGEIEACRWWLDQELALLAPRLTIALGATAARALSGRLLTIGRERGRLMHFRDGLPGFVTVHPSYLLRLPDQAAQRSEYRRFVEELAMIGKEVEDVRL